MEDSTNKDVSMVDVSSAEHAEHAGPEHLEHFEHREHGDPEDPLLEVPSKPALTEGKKHQNHDATPKQRRRSTIVLTDDLEMETRNEAPHRHRRHSHGMQVDTHAAGQNTPPDIQSPNIASQPPSIDPNITVPIDIKWVQGGEKVYVTGSFTEWRKMIGLVKQPDNLFLITLGLPVGTHRFRFVVDNELRFSDHMPTATDQMGNFVNYIEVTPEYVQSHLQEKDEMVISDGELLQSSSRRSSVSKSSTRSDSIWGLSAAEDEDGGYTQYKDGEEAMEPRKYDYISDIPPIFTDPQVMEQYYMAIEKQSKSSNGQQAWLYPPQLPPHLEHVILNNYNSLDKDNNSGALPIPNHVVLNHLATTSIKHNTLAVASVVRYNSKYVTQVLYAPLQQ